MSSHFSRRGSSLRIPWAFLDHERNTRMVMAAPFQSMTLGALRITYVPDGYALLKPTGLFPTTRETGWQDEQHFLDEPGQLVASVGAHVIQTPSHTLLVDTAYGPADSEGPIVTLHGGHSSRISKKPGLIQPTSRLFSLRTCTVIMSVGPVRSLMGNRSSPSPMLVFWSEARHGIASMIRQKAAPLLRPPRLSWPNPQNLPLLNPT